MPRIGPFEAVIVLVIILVIFGVGRLTGVGGALGKGMREFRHGISGKSDDGEGGKAEEKDS